MFAQIVYKSFASNPDYFVLCERGVLRVVQDETQSDYAVGEFVVIRGVKKGNVLYASDIELAAEEDEKNLEEAKREWERALVDVNEPTPLVNSPVLARMGLAFKKAATFLQLALLHMQPITVRFDEDTDGITSALYLHGLVEHFIRDKRLPYPKSFFRAFQSDAPIFEHKHLNQLKDLSEDFARKPLLVLLDHGGNEESFAALQIAKKEGFNLLLIDHHPPWTPSLEIFDSALHPAQHAGSSDLCTGLLAYHLAACVYAAPKEWAYYAMQGDRSSLAVKEFFKEPIVLDYVSLKKLELKQYASLLNDKNRVELLYERCMRLREKALQNAIQHRRIQHFGRLTVQWLDVAYITQEYPPRGGVVQGLHEHFERGGPLVTVGYDSERVIFRANEGAEAQGFKANEWIADFKKIPGIIASGGGHPRAASLRLKPKKITIILEVLEKRFAKSFS